MSRYPFQSVFLDTCVVHYMATLPNLFFEGGPDDEEWARLQRLKTRHRDDILALSALTVMCQRAAPHDIVITPCVVRELRPTARQYGAELLEWCREMSWFQVESSHTFLDGYASMLDPYDRHLYLEANANGCEAFLTTDYRSIVQRRHRLPRSMSRVLTPGEWWSEMKPWAGLFL